MRRFLCSRYLLALAFKTILFTHLLVEVLPLRLRRKRKTLQADSPDCLVFPFVDFQV